MAGEHRRHLPQNVESYNKQFMPIPATAEDQRRAERTARAQGTFAKINAKITKKTV
jgi:hypothetical protein